jgi:diguanylate cyclase (GGDEF)-like protein
VQILLIDQSEDFLLSLETTLRRDCALSGDLTIDHASTPEQAVAKLTGNGYDLCFLDTRLGSEGGFEILRAFENLDLRTAFIFITDTDDKTDVYTALSLGAMDYMLKSKLDSFGLLKSLSFSLYHKGKEMEYRGAALRDGLTGLGNRTLFYEQASKLLQQAKRAQERLAIVFIDVDGLKQVNDTHGHPVGDKLLKKVANRLKSRMRESDIIARVGGDEFVALLGRIDSLERATKLANGLSDAVAGAAFDVDGKSITVGVSVGTASYPEDSDNLDNLVRLADQRMYDAKPRKRPPSPKSKTMVWPK